MAHRKGAVLPPVVLSRHPDGYYVVDGRHRVSVARALRHQEIDAWVSGPRQ
ncbi:MAG: ParB N-terminal domain-containing protein [Solirubrobacterales bacterium]|nr:ParB N-terminal domain-containing protein [Solirubrobacterales bacterium]